MKKLSLVFMLLFSLGATLNAQEAESEASTTKTEEPDTTKITWGKKKILIISSESEGIDTIKIKRERRQRTNKFAGVDLGVNGYLSPKNSTDLQQNAEFMDLNYGKSLEVGINIYEKYIPIAKEKFGLMTGLGVKYNNYDIDNDVVIINQDNETVAVVDSTRSIKKNKFKTTMVDVPLMMETNLGRDAEHSFHFAVGGMVSYRLASKTKQKYSQGSEDYKKKNRNDFNLNPFRFSAVARIGYGDFTLYASYSLTPMFEKDKGPELYPFTIGLSLVSF